MKSLIGRAGLLELVAEASYGLSTRLDLAGSWVAWVA